MQHRREAGLFHLYKVAVFQQPAPDITTAIINGRQPQSLQLQTLMKNGAIPNDWNEQRKALGF